MDMAVGGRGGRPTVQSVVDEWVNGIYTHYTEGVSIFMERKVYKARVMLQEHFSLLYITTSIVLARTCYRTLGSASLQCRIENVASCHLF